MHIQTGDAATTLVWIDSEEEIIVRWADRANVERIPSERPGRHRSTGHVRADPTGRNGGRSGPDGAEQVRRARLAAIVEEVAEHLPPDGDVVVVGPGLVRSRRERSLRADDRRLGRHRRVHTTAAVHLTEQELVARVRELAGDAPKRLGPAP